uniref:3,4-dihydroxy-2-butanone-4-phosphate synthase n=1 Tax=Nelumbo nucifera TaxID=4432 RepID=A0A822Z8Y3_NELNU|nr:TPA_asm: hypothetical protein HUJ06_015356 [Nelumbo nucifera]
MASINLSSHTVIFSSQCRKFNCFNGLHSMNTFNANGITSDLAFANLSRKPCLRLKGDYKARATLVSGEGGLLSYPEGNADVGQSSLIDREREKGVEMQPDAVAFGTLATDVASTSDDVFVNKDELDLDYPTEGFSSIPEAIEDIRQGKLVIVVDDEDRENEGDLIMAASLVTTATMAFIVKHGTGIVCVSMKGEDLERLELPLMVATKENDEKLCTAFTVSVDAKHGTTTGVSAHDRATTVLALASKDSKPEDFNRPGHIFPLKYREGGVLKRAGHTEASVDLAVLAGLDPVAILCEIVDDDGSMARLPKLRQFAQRENLKIISIADLIRYRRKRDKLVERASAAPLPLAWGAFRAYCYKSLLDGMEHIAMVKVRSGIEVFMHMHFLFFFHIL